MKHSMLSLMLGCIVTLAWVPAQAQTADVIATVATDRYADSLMTSTGGSLNGSAHDTVDVIFTNAQTFGYYQIDAWSSATDTLNVGVLGLDLLGTYCPRALMETSNATLTTARVAIAVTGTTMKQWIVLGGVQIPRFRFTSGANGVNAIRFVVSGRRGVPYY